MGRGQEGGDQLARSCACAGPSRTPDLPYAMLCLQVNTKSDDLAKVATDFNANEIAFFRKIVDRIIRAPNSRYCIKHHDAIRLCNKIDPPLKKADAQRILGTFVKKGTHQLFHPDIACLTNSLPRLAFCLEQSRLFTLRPGRARA